MIYYNLFYYASVSSTLILQHVPAPEAILQAQRQCCKTHFKVSSSHACTQLKPLNTPIFSFTSYSYLESMLDLQLKCVCN